MSGKKIKQINNLVITQDTTKAINWFGEARFNPNYGKYSVWTPDGRCIEDGLSLKQAEEFCKNTKDYILNKASLDDVIQTASAVAKQDASDRVDKGRNKGYSLSK